MCVENFCNMVCMLPSHVLDAKAINGERERDGPPIMFPKAWHDFALLVAILVKLFFEEILCKDACMWETVHTLLNFDKDGTIVIGQLFEFIEIDKLRIEVTEFHGY